jgi:type I restriction enzyme S subunit
VNEVDYSTLESIMAPSRGSVDPSAFPDEEFDLYSVPAFDAGAPERVKGRMIGSTKQVVLPDDVLLSRIVPHIRRAWVVATTDGRRLIASGEWIVFRSPRVDPRYLRHFLMSDRCHSQLMRTVSGVGGSLLRARRAQVGMIRMPIPAIAEQLRVAAALEMAETLRTGAANLEALWEHCLQSVFHRQFDERATGLRYDRVALGEISTIAGGLQVTTKRSGLDLRLPYLRVANVYRDRLDLTEVKSINVTANELERNILEEGDLLLVEGHGNPNELGRSAVWDGSVAPCTHQNHLIRVRLDADLATPDYVCAFLNSSAGRSQLLANAKTTSGLNTLSTSNVKRLRIPVPPLTEQLRYTRLKRRVAQQRATHAMRRSKTEELRLALSDKYFGS